LHRIRFKQQWFAVNVPLQQGQAADTRRFNGLSVIDSHDP
jgi:hypothetical protein